MELDSLEIVEDAYKIINLIYIVFCLLFMVTEIYVRTNRTCYRPFAWNLIIDFTTINLLGMFAFLMYTSCMSTEMVTFIYIVLIIYFLRKFINGILDRRYLQQ